MTTLFPNVVLLTRCPRCLARDAALTARSQAPRNTPGLLELDVPALPTRLPDEADVADAHVLLRCLRHVVHRERRHRDRRQRLHLYARLRRRAHPRCDLDRPSALVRIERYLDPRKRQRMAERDQL